MAFMGQDVQNGKKIVLNHLINGDKDNSFYYTRYDEEDLETRCLLEYLLENWQDKVSRVIDGIFYEKIDDKMYNQIMKVLTFWDMLMFRKNLSFDIGANELFFVTLVNYIAVKQPGVRRIKDYPEFYAARDTAKEHGHPLDYREYVIRGEGEDDFKGEYLPIVISPNQFSGKLKVFVPIKSVGPRRLGMIRVCTNNVPASFSFVEDQDNEAYTIPAYIWINMLRDGMSRRSSIRFSKAEGKHLASLMNSDERFILDILSTNNFVNAFSLDKTNGGFDYDFDTDTGAVIIENVKILPAIEKHGSIVEGFEWNRIGQRDYLLRSPKFYIANLHKGAINILVER